MKGVLTYLFLDGVPTGSPHAKVKTKAKQDKQKQPTKMKNKKQSLQERLKLFYQPRLVQKVLTLALGSKWEGFLILLHVTGRSVSEVFMSFSLKLKNTIER